MIPICGVITPGTPEVGGPGAGGACAPQVLRYQLTLCGPRGADYARHITTGPPIFLNDAASLFMKSRAINHTNVDVPLNKLHEIK